MRKKKNENHINELVDRSLIHIPLTHGYTLNNNTKKHMLIITQFWNKENFRLP